MVVTPFVGVWIETPPVEEPTPPPSVTPFVGVWIETVDASIALQKSQVTPFVGVWIETKPYLAETLKEIESHPSWVCGLKQICTYH